MMLFYQFNLVIRTKKDNFGFLPAVIGLQCQHYGLPNEVSFFFSNVRIIITVPKYYSFLFKGSPNNILSLDLIDGKGYLVMNKHNKCISYLRQFKMVQTISNSTDTRQLWKWKGSSLRNIMMDLFVSLTRKETAWNQKREPIPLFEVTLFRSLTTSE